MRQEKEEEDTPPLKITLMRQCKDYIKRKTNYNGHNQHCQHKDKQNNNKSQETEMGRKTTV